MGDLDNLTRNGTWDSNGDINVVFLDIDLWGNLGLDNGVSGSRASWDGCWGDGSIRCWGSRDGGRGKSNGCNEVLGFSSNIRMGRLGDGLLSSNGVSMSSNNLLDSGLDKRPSPSLLILMLLEKPRTSLLPLLFPLPPSLLPQHLMLPSPQHLSQLALLPLTPLSRPRSLMSPLLSHVLFPVRSSRSPTLPSLMRFPSHVPSMSQLPTRFTPSRRLLRLPTSTTPHMRLTPARLS